MWLFVAWRPRVNDGRAAGHRSPCCPRPVRHRSLAKVGTLAGVAAELPAQVLVHRRPRQLPQSLPALAPAMGPPSAAPRPRAVNTMSKQAETKAPGYGGDPFVGLLQRERQRPRPPGRSTCAAQSTEDPGRRQGIAFSPLSPCGGPNPPERQGNRRHSTTAAPSRKWRISWPFGVSSGTAGAASHARGRWFETTRPHQKAANADVSPNPVRPWPVDVYARLLRGEN